MYSLSPYLGMFRLKGHEQMDMLIDGSVNGYLQSTNGSFDMTYMRRIAILALLVLFPLTGAFAAPKQGFGLYGGMASYGSSGKITKGAFDGETYNISSSGLSFGGDYQLPVSDNVSLNFLFMTSSEGASSSKLDIDGATHGLLGVEGRYWFGDYFAGAHVGSYTETLTSSKAGSSSTSGSGFGAGASIGWAKPDSGLFVMGQYDNATIEYSDAKSNLSGLRAQVGYRWGN